MPSQRHILDRYIWRILFGRIDRKLIIVHKVSLWRFIKLAEWALITHIAILLYLIVYVAFKVKFLVKVTYETLPSFDVFHFFSPLLQGILSFICHLWELKIYLTLHTSSLFGVISTFLGKTTFPFIHNKITLARPELCEDHIIWKFS